MNFRAKVQQNGDRLFVYLPLGQCRDEKIIKGSKVDFKDCVNTGLPAEPPTERAKAMGKNNPKIKKNQKVEDKKTPEIPKKELSPAEEFISAHETRSNRGI